MKTDEYSRNLIILNTGKSIMLPIGLATIAFISIPFIIPAIVVGFLSAVYLYFSPSNRNIIQGICFWICLLSGSFALFISLSLMVNEHATSTVNPADISVSHEATQYPIIESATE
ncbi:hypothetical protein [Stomatohabitans albus]|uniref:hypothetical protein n=1 Tax=Stomatohabitans albus TaxID=3110766 RepID=UPI00300C3619